MALTSKRKSPNQARARATVAAIREACARILETGGPLTTNHVAERAGVSVGTLYQYYPRKEAILADLILAMRQELLEDLVAAERDTRDAPLEVCLRQMLWASVQHHARNPARAAALEAIEDQLVAQAGADPLAGEIAEVKGRIGSLVAGLLTRHGVRDPGIAARDLSVMSAALVGAAARDGEEDIDLILERLIRAARGYLGIA